MLQLQAHPVLVVLKTIVSLIVSMTTHCKFFGWFKKHGFTEFLLPLSHTDTQRQTTGLWEPFSFLQGMMICSAVLASVGDVCFQEMGASKETLLLAEGHISVRLSVSYVPRK